MHNAKICDAKSFRSKLVKDKNEPFETNQGKVTQNHKYMSKLLL